MELRLAGATVVDGSVPGVVGTLVAVAVGVRGTVVAVTWGVGRAVTVAVTVAVAAVAVAAVAAVAVGVTGGNIEGGGISGGAGGGVRSAGGVGGMIFSFCAGTRWMVMMIWRPGLCEGLLKAGGKGGGGGTDNID
ncbi:hypothetical protein KDAU_28400 [Dictyobacter aurantiacus]|uniref:Uncharacterized protein n=1 Tax=Dictyobacter aurantiacus TaxID=1936993 RepID=A0A401ZF40_9CHLR|nr:hypothetical protein KDAU_28400 [Dictyobacter aurantiacus]